MSSAKTETILPICWLRLSPLRDQRVMKKGQLYISFSRFRRVFAQSVPRLGYSWRSQGCPYSLPYRSPECSVRTDCSSSSAKPSANCITAGLNPQQVSAHSFPQAAWDDWGQGSPKTPPQTLPIYVERGETKCTYDYAHFRTLFQVEGRRLHVLPTELWGPATTPITSP